jgi:hypothetical protein
MLKSDFFFTIFIRKEETKWMRDQLMQGLDLREGLAYGNGLRQMGTLIISWRNCSTGSEGPPGIKQSGRI